MRSLNTVAITRAHAAAGAVSRGKTWWIALGHEADSGLVLGGVWRPWRDATEATTWQWWARGGGNRRRAAACFAQFPDAAWWLAITSAFRQGLTSGTTPALWRDPRLAPTLARLRWVPVWPWDASVARWVGPGIRWPALPGFEPWAAVGQPEQPLRLADWFEAGFAAADSTLRVPWLYAVLGQTVMLQALGAGYWDWVEGYYA